MTWVSFCKRSVAVSVLRASWVLWSTSCVPLHDGYSADPHGLSPRTHPHLTMAAPASPSSFSKFQQTPQSLLLKCYCNLHNHVIYINANDSLHRQSNSCPKRDTLFLPFISASRWGVLSTKRRETSRGYGAASETGSR